MVKAHERLATAERERKRARDRLYQRRKRERDRELISKLKERIEASEADLRSPTSRKSELEENVGLTNISREMSSLSRNGDSITPPSADRENLPDPFEMEFENTQLLFSSMERESEKFPDPLSELLSHSCIPLGLNLENDSTIPQNESQYSSADTLNIGNSLSFVEDDQNCLKTSNIEQARQRTSSATGDAVISTSLLPSSWTTLNSLFQDATRPDTSLENSLSARDFDYHVIITGILYGWDEVASTFKSTAVWECLKNVDQLALSYSGIVERMAALKTIALLLRSQAGTHAHSLLPRPSQLAVEHPGLIDYFIWPGFRERMVFQYIKYASDDFARRFSQSYKFVWPDSAKTVYTKIPHSPLYKFTDEFLACSNDIQRYRMDRNFLVMYPEFYADVPVTGSIPLDLGPPTYSMGWNFTQHSDSDDQDQFCDSRLRDS